MSREWVDIVDTSVKIGLGALITGVFTYLGIRYSHKSERRKFMLGHNAKLLEQAAEDVEKYFSSWDYFVGTVGGIATHRDNAGIEDEQFTTEEMKDIINSDSNLVESWSKRESALSKLRLMKATKASEALESIVKLENKFRSPILFDKKIPKSGEVAEYRVAIVNAMKDVHMELADFYATF